MKDRKLRIALAAVLILTLVVPMSGFVFGASTLKKPTVTALTSSDAGTITITTSWDKNAKGYEVVCSESSNFKSPKTKTFTGNRLWKKNVTGLTSNKTYYVKVRAYGKNSSGKKVYGKFSSKKKIKIAGYVTGYTTDYLLRVKTKKNKNAKEITLPYKSKVKVSSTLAARKTAQWVKLKYNGKIYYKYCEKKVTYFTSKGVNYNDYKNLKVGPVQQAVVDQAFNILRNEKTVYGNTAKIEPGTRDSKGRMIFDCSGFTSYVLNGVMNQYVPNYDVSNGITTQKDTGYLYTDAAGKFTAKKVCSDKPDFSLLQPGDLVFFNDSTSKFTGKCDHVGIYVGNKEFIHCVSTVNRVVLMPLNSGRYKERFLFAKRFTPAQIPVSMEKDMVVKSRYSNGENVYRDYRFNNKNGDRVLGGEPVKLMYSAICRWRDDGVESCFIEYGNGRTGYIQSTFLVNP